jgi:molybdopterin molybdotransferase
MKPSWQTVLRACLGQAASLGTETVARADALGRVLAQTVVADRDYPAGHLSTMDGYAVDSIPRVSFPVAGENRPGIGPGDPLAGGTARRIFTGGELPSGATRVIPQEMTQREGDLLKVTEYPETNFVRERGSEGARGTAVLEPGLRLGPVDLSILASLGADHVAVQARPRVAHLVTGDEVMAAHEKGEPGTRIRDSNSDLVSAVLAGVGQSVADHRRVPDDRDAACQIVQEMASRCDVLLVSGGASVGDHDHARAALESAGFHFEAHGLDVRPGKPVGLARRGKQWAIALPGNPVSHLVALHLFVRPLLLALEGATPAEPRPLRGTLRSPSAAPIPKRDTFWPSVAEIADGSYQLTPCRFLTSGDLLGVAGANALLVLPTGQPVPQPGDAIFFLSLAPDFSNALPR